MLYCENNNNINRCESIYYLSNYINNQFKSNKYIDKFFKIFVILTYFTFIFFPYKYLCAQIEIKMSGSFDDAAKCSKNCDNIDLSYEGNVRYTGFLPIPVPFGYVSKSATYKYNRGDIGCNNNTATCTRLDFYEMRLYGNNVNMDSYAYKHEDDWYLTWKWDCEGSWQRCWYKSGFLVRPTCNWNSGYGYSTSYTIGDLKQEVASEVDAENKAKAYCLGLWQTTSCRDSCKPTASLYVNGNLVSTIEGFLDALTKEQAVNGLIKKIGTDSMLELYDPNKIY